MGLGFRKSIKIAPGVKVNINKKSVGVTMGGKGFHHTVNTSGRKTTSVGIPGTGLSYSSTSQSKKSKPQATTQTSKEATSASYKPFDNKAVSKSRPAPQPRKKGKTLKIWGIVLICISVIGMIGLFADGDFYNGLIGCGVLLIIGVILFINGKKKLASEPQASQPKYTNTESEYDNRNNDLYDFGVHDKKYEDAMDLYFGNMEKLQTNASILYNLGVTDGEKMDELIKLCYRNIEQFKIACGQWKRYGESIPPSCPAFERLAIIYERQGKFDDAIKICIEAIKTGLSESDYKKRIARLLKKSGTQDLEKYQDLLL